eukprot:1069673-Prymnesium_polylepis.1
MVSGPCASTNPEGTHAIQLVLPSALFDAIGTAPPVSSPAPPPQPANPGPADAPADLVALVSRHKHLWAATAVAGQRTPPRSVLGATRSPVRRADSPRHTHATSRLSAHGVAADALLADAPRCRLAPQASPPSKATAIPTWRLALRVISIGYSSRRRCSREHATSSGASGSAGGAPLATVMAGLWPPLQTAQTSSSRRFARYASSPPMARRQRWCRQQSASRPKLICAMQSTSLWPARHRKAQRPRWRLRRCGEGVVHGRAAAARRSVLQSAQYA